MQHNNSQYPHTEDVGANPSPVQSAYEAALMIAAEMSIDSLLQRIVELSRSVGHARVAALRQAGLAGEETSIIHTGDAGKSWSEIDLTTTLNTIFAHVTEITTAISLPQLSLLQGLGDIAPDTAGLPVLIVPIMSDRLQIGMLILLGHEDKPTFDDADMDAITLLAAHAATAIERARMFDLAELRNTSARGQLLQVRQVLDNMPAGVLVMQGPEGRVRMANTTANEMILGHRESADVPTIYRDYRWRGPDGQELPRSGHPGILALHGERLENRQYTIEGAGGVTLPVLVQAAPVYSEQDEIVSSVVVFQDFSSLRAAEQIKDDFLSLISHEFRTPLTAIHGGALLLQQQWEDLDEETRRELLEDIGAESSRLNNMLSNLLSVAEIMAGKFRQDTEPVLVGPLVEELVQEFAERTPTHVLSLDVELDLPLAESDPAWLAQIMRNLYENAIKYSPSGGEIRTRIGRHQDQVRISVIDEGLGILPEHVPHVFERFRRPGADPTVRGMGLGLYLSRLLVDAMGGSIHAASDGPGEGSTFTVELPVVREWN